MYGKNGKRYIRIILAALLILCMSLCCVSCVHSNDGGTDVPPPVDIDDPSKNEAETYTLLIYMCASDLESDYGAATANINELLNADIPSNVNVVIQAGGTNRWRNDYFSSVVTERAEIKNKELKSIDRIPKANFGDPASLSSFMLWGINTYPADNYGIIFWDHGGGSLKGVCFDELFYFDSLSLKELETGLAYGVSLTGKKFDFVGFDACLMANYETASTVAPYAETMLASEENEPNGGWDYTTLAENIGKDDFFDKALSSYAAKCEKKNKQTYTLSSIDLTKFSSVKTALGAFVEKIDELPLAQVVRSAGKALCFGTNKRTVFSDLIDLSEFALAAGDANVKEAVATCVKSVSGEYRKTATGLSIYFPLNSVKEINKYLEISSEDGYKTFLSANYTDTSAGQIFIVNGGTDDDGKLKAQISSDSVNKLTKVMYNLFRIVLNEEIETVYGMGEDTDITYDGTNGYTVAFEGRWVAFNGSYINCSVEADNTDYTEYSSPIKLNGVLAEMRFVFDKKTRTLELQGYTPIDGNIGVGGRTNDFAVGDNIILLYDDRTDYEHNLMDGDTFEYSDTTALEIACLPAGCYQYNMFFYDAYGNEYRSDTAVIYFDGTDVRITTITDDEVIYG